MKFLLIVVGTIVVANALSTKEQWESFKLNHNKSYAHFLEENYRLSVFQSNLKKIEEHNARYKKGEVSYYMGVTKFADLTAKEFMSILNKQLGTKPKSHATPAQLSDDPVPDSFDWRESGAVLEVKDQGNCGSCWAFSTTGALEAQNYLTNKVTLPLSEQELVDCSRLYGNSGCGGGDMEAAFKYIKSKGLSSEEAYPYEAKDDTCKRNASNIVLKVKDFQTVANNDDSLRRAIATVGPISIAMQATTHLQLYKGGILNDPSCVNYAPFMNHGVLAVGYGTQDDTDYWIVKNSWGTLWGEEGFFRIQRNTCCITCDASFPRL
ncbi:unnamed protein product [Diabrotica balteata]|uniref:Uncharacterized protein n=1 Tax=Diabrotica balteata TaxID=107213 RepID=A0A9N9T047_DIABA|nr:unnamed protein product [Diabrotica balteata]